MEGKIMPNWTENYLFVEFDAKDKKQVKFINSFVRAIKKGKMLNFLKPMPKHQPDLNKPNAFFGEGGLGQEEKLKFGENNWYDWSIHNWGTKWDIPVDSLSINLDELENGKLFVGFDSAWSPPLKAIVELYEKHKFKFNLYFVEYGMGVFGQLKNSDYGEAGLPSGYENFKTIEDLRKHLTKLCNDASIDTDIIEDIGLLSTLGGFYMDNKEEIQ
jgi:hypothetical protein